MADYPFERLIMDLLEREDTFERLLTLEHVKDRLIDRPIHRYHELALAAGEEYTSTTLTGLLKKEILLRLVSY